MTTTDTQLEGETLKGCPFCGVVPVMQSHTQEDEMDGGRYVFFVECGNSQCPMGLVSTGGPYRNAEKAAERWNTRRAAVAGPLGETFTAEVIGDSLQKRLFDECVTANWDPERKNTFAEEIAHLHEELSEAFRAFRRYKDFAIREVNGKLEGVPIEFADALIGMFYNAELHGFNLLDAIERKHQFNLGRNYIAEGRQLHAPAATSSTTPAESMQSLSGTVEQLDGSVATFWPPRTPAESTRVAGEQAQEIDVIDKEAIYEPLSQIRLTCAAFRRLLEIARAAAAAPADNDAESLLSKITIIADIGSAEEFGDALERLKSIRELIATTTTKGDR